MPCRVCPPDSSARNAGSGSIPSTVLSLDESEPSPAWCSSTLRLVFLILGCYLVSTTLFRLKQIAPPACGFQSFLLRKSVQQLFDFSTALSH